MWDILAKYQCVWHGGTIPPIHGHFHGENDDQPVHLGVPNAQTIARPAGRIGMTPGPLGSTNRKNVENPMAFRDNDL